MTPRLDSALPARNDCNGQVSFWCPPGIACEPGLQEKTSLKNQRGFAFQIQMMIVRLAQQSAVDGLADIGDDHWGLPTERFHS